ncbi:AI-2E family transporter [soil metagenome]
MRGEIWRWIGRGGGFTVGVLLVAAIAMVAISAAQVLVLAFISVLLAAALDPITYWVRRRARRVSRAATVLGVYVLFMVAVATLLLLVVPAALDQLNDLSGRAPQLLEDLRVSLQGLEPAVLATAADGLIGALEVMLARAGLSSPDPETLIEVGLTAADVVISVTSVLALTFFWLVGRESMQRFLLALLPPERHGGVREGWNEVESRLGQWVGGQLILMTVIGVATTIAYVVLGLENALLLGVIAGIAELIPIVGPAIGAVPALIVAVVTGGPELALLVAAVYVVIQVVEGNVLVPWVMKNAVGLPPFIVILSLLVGAAVAGLVGAMLAIPVTAAGMVVLQRAQTRSVPVTMVASEGDKANDDGDDDAADPEAADGAPGLATADR